jgi:hypothetical protein
MRARFLGQGWQDRSLRRRENACVPFVDVGSWVLETLAMGISGTHTTRPSLALLRQNNAEPCARTVHTLRIAGRGWHISGLVGVATSTLGPLFGRVGQPWVCKDTVNVFCLLSISLATLDPAVRVVCVRR